MSKQVTALEFVSSLPAEIQATMPLYCGCLDWNTEFKEFQVGTMNDFNRKLHMTGVSASEANAYYHNGAGVLTNVND